MTWFFYVVRKDAEIVYHGSNFAEARAALPERQFSGEKYSCTCFGIYDENPEKKVISIRRTLNATRKNFVLGEEGGITIPLEDMELMADKDLQNFRTSD